MFVDDNDDEDEYEDDKAPEYRRQSFSTGMHDRERRAIVVLSSELDGRKERRIDREVSQTEAAVEEAIEDLEDRYFECEPDTEAAATTWLRDHDDELFSIDLDVTETERKKSCDKPGRPPNDWELSETAHQVEATLTRNEEAIADYKAR